VKNLENKLQRKEDNSNIIKNSEIINMQKSQKIAELLKIAYSLVDLSKELPGTKGVMIGGSLAMGADQADSGSDIDVTVIVPHILPIEERKKFWQKQLAHLPGISEVVCGHTCDRFKVNSRNLGGVDYWLVNEVEQSLQKVFGNPNVAYQPAYGAIFGLCPETICGEIIRSTVIWDPEGLICAWKKKVEVYPERFRREVIGESYFDILFMLSFLRRASELNDVIFCRLVQSKILFCTLRILSAINKTYFRGVKRVLTDAKNFKIIPVGGLEKLEKIATGSLKRTELSVTYQNMRQFTREVVSLIDSLGPEYQKLRKSMEGWPDIDTL